MIENLHRDVYICSRPPGQPEPVYLLHTFSCRFYHLRQDSQGSPNHAVASDAPEEGNSISMADGYSKCKEQLSD